MRATLSCQILPLDKQTSVYLSSPYSVVLVDTRDTM